MYRIKDSVTSQQRVDYEALAVSTSTATVESLELSVQDLVLFQGHLDSCSFSPARDIP